jgi:hypothetical protein
MYRKDQVCFLFLDPQDEVGPSVSSLVVCKVHIFYNLLSFFFITFLSPEIATSITIRGPFS